ncbi:2OG-Fe(II) oxygenase [Corallococcus terminator]|uniref:2OG-Fe(II) oxygenase n=1 Tax=Corallococcus terminator TaxID=2316733 RepID=A0A3A8JF67_9BACT|nr:2OG-Fe(II) oxygenase [Corallococcus terminator]
MIRATEKSSPDSPATSSPRPERPSGFFVANFADSVFGHVRAKPPSAFPPSASGWSPLANASPKLHDAIRHEFVSGGRVPHVCLQRVLLPERAEAMRLALRDARFQRHHHGPYPLHIAPLAQQAPGVLSDFCAWLASEDGADFHAALVGWPQKLETRQVQVSRMDVGEQFPEHRDTDEEGVAVVYNFTRPWQESFGGVLAFPHPDGDRDLMRVPPIFNSVFIFRAVNAPHRVTEWLPAAQGHQRYSITAFMLAKR